MAEFPGDPPLQLHK